MTLTPSPIPFTLLSRLPSRLVSERRIRSPFDALAKLNGGKSTHLQILKSIRQMQLKNMTKGKNEAGEAYCEQRSGQMLININCTTFPLKAVGKAFAQIFISAIQ